MWWPLLSFKSELKSMVVVPKWDGATPGAIAVLPGRRLRDLVVGTGDRADFGAGAHVVFEHQHVEAAARDVYFGVE